MMRYTADRVSRRRGIFFGKAGMAMLVMAASAAWCVCVPGPAVAAPRATARIVAVVIDSTSSMTPDQQMMFRMFRDITHGEAVCRFVEQIGRPDELKFFNVDDDQGEFDIEAYHHALLATARLCRDHPHDKVVVNISLGSYIVDAVEKALIAELIGRGAVVVAAAGNENRDLVAFPAAHPGVVAVAATEHRRKAPYSNYGKRIDIAADGSFESYQTVRLPQSTHSRDVVCHGTSFAAPRVAGTIVKVLRMTGAAAGDARDIVIAAAVPIDCTYYREGKLGAGLLSRHRAYRTAQPGYWLPWLAGAMVVPIILVAGSARLGVSDGRLLWGRLGFVLVLSTAAGLAWLGAIKVFATYLPASLDLPVALLAWGAVLVVAAVGVRAGHAAALRWIRSAACRAVLQGQTHGPLGDMKRGGKHVVSEIKTATLCGVVQAGEPALPFLTRWLSEGRSPALDPIMAACLADYRQRRRLLDQLAVIALSDGEELHVRTNAVVSLGKIAPRQDRGIRAVLRWLAHEYPPLGEEAATAARMVTRPAGARRLDHCPDTLAAVRQAPAKRLAREAWAEEADASAEPSPPPVISAEELRDLMEKAQIPGHLVDQVIRRHPT